MVIFSAFSNIYSGGLFVLTNKNLESAGTCGFQTKFKQIALSDALLTFFGDCSALRCENLSLCHHGELSFSPSACGGHYVFTHEDIVFLRRTIHFRSCAQDETATVFKNDEDLDKIFYYRSYSLIFNIFIFLVWMYFVLFAKRIIYMGSL